MANFFGTSGSDSIAGGNSADSVVAYAGSDTIEGRDGNDTVDAGAGDDVITGGRGADSLLGGAGADQFLIMAENEIASSGETYDGGAGWDSLVIAQDGVDISALTLTNIEQLDAGFNAIQLTSAQLDQFISIQAYSVTLTSGGTIDFSGLTLFVSRFILEDAATSINLSSNL